MKSLLLVFLVVSLASAESNPANSRPSPAVAGCSGKRGPGINELLGVWEVDLRPTPEAAPYVKRLVLKRVKRDKIIGEFYGTRFTNGRFSTQWDVLHFAFTTRDGSGVYYHSGTFDGDSLRGQSYSPERGFVQPWTHTRRLE